jgi:hypothetical protein
VKQGRRGAVDPAHREVEVTVTVEIGEERSGAAHSRERHAGGGADLCEGTVAAVAEQQVGTDVAAHHVEIHPAVAVVVAGGDTAGVLRGLAELRELRETVLVGEARVGGDVGEVPGGVDRRGSDEGRDPRRGRRKTRADPHRSILHQRSS